MNLKILSLNTVDIVILIFVKKMGESLEQNLFLLFYETSDGLLYGVSSTNSNQATP